MPAFKKEKIIKSWVSAGSLNLFTALIHLISGHFEIVNPLLNSTIDTVVLATLYACWHMVTVILFGSSILLLYIGIKPTQFLSNYLATIVGTLYILFSLVFMILMIEYGFSNLPQWTLLLPIGLLSLYGTKKQKSLYE